ncbi:hypothetical protein ET495_16895 [Xylanimonas allomyrinae]|uniref:Right-handed parallel beta-helix repeat-containing protein n=1 Tax=Xylanimonas allomyrinae TaxID=2509459 RepID=A0A4P6ESR3_9MICO|nr:hypothetical protein [Xylanimonas allomyrinae]QAY64599.1 hypothetical protein ET495_16895 [Xylanimonas allomyrinae]
MRPRRGGGLRRAAALAAVAALAVVPVVVAVEVASATGYVLPVDSLGLEPAAGNLTDGFCESTVGTCTLRAAIEEANALKGAPGDVTITVHPSFAGGVIPLDNAVGTRMLTTSPSSGATVTGDAGAYLVVTQPVTIDLGHRIKLQDAAPTTAESASAAVFYLNGPDITVRGVDDTYSSQTTFYVGPQATRVSITDGSVTTPNTDAKRFLVVRGGASNVTLRGYQVSGYGSLGTAADAPTQGWVMVDGATVSPVMDLLVDGNTFTVATPGARCDTSTAAGCTAPAVNFNSAVGQQATRFTFSNNVVRGLNQRGENWHAGIDMGRAKLTDTVISGNTFEDCQMSGADASALIEMNTHSTSSMAVIDGIRIDHNAFSGLRTAVEGGINSGVIRFPGIGGRSRASRRWSTTTSRPARASSGRRRSRGCRPGALPPR